MPAYNKKENTLDTCMYGGADRLLTEHRENGAKGLYFFLVLCY